MIDEETLITPTLLRRFLLEAYCDGGDGRHYAIIRKPDGHVLVHHEQPASPKLALEQLTWAADLLRLLNREIHHDGAWVIVFTHPETPHYESILHSTPTHWKYRRYAILWIDEDGDPQFTQEWSQNDSEMLDFADVVVAGLESTAAKAETAWQLWNTHMRDVLDPAEGQLVKAAKGERRAARRG